MLSIYMLASSGDMLGPPKHAYVLWPCFGHHTSFLHVLPQVLHQSRVKPSLVEREAGAGALLERLNQEGCFYTAPHGHNDDWYWLHAAVRAGARPFIVFCPRPGCEVFFMDL